FGHIFFGPDWGLVFTAPFLLLGVWGLFLLDVPWKKKYILLSIPILVNFYIIFVSGHQGSYYGYRYLIATAFPLFVIPLAFLLKRLENKVSYWKWGAVLLALLPVMSMWCYESNVWVTLSPTPTFFGTTDWSNDTYQIAVWQSIFDLKLLWRVIYFGGVKYFYFLLKTLIGSRDNFSFEIKTLIQIFIIYSLPFVTCWILRNKVLEGEGCQYKKLK
ncbi:MAG: hypothetical protein WCH62_07365, partial [Candidatus Omnitrophota bacterium]